MGLEVKLPTLELRLPEISGLQLKDNIEEEEVEEEIIDEREAQELGMHERTDATRIAAGPGWEIFIEPLNYVIREGQHYTYYSKFEYLLDVLLERRVKFYLAQERILRIDVALEKAQEDIHETLKNISKVLRFLGEKYSINDSSLL